MVCNNERGVVLLLVLVIITLLGFVLSDLAYTTLIDVRLNETFRDSTKAEYLARGGIVAGRMVLRQDSNSYDAYSSDELWSLGIRDYPVAQGSVTITIEDLDGRFPLNQLVDSLGNRNIVFEERFIRLCRELGIDNPEALADALVDWLDPDQERSPAGAEDADYLARTPPYEAADGPLADPDELLLIEGFSAAIVKRLAPFVSSFGRERLNINTAAAELLRSWDSDSASAVEALLNQRAAKPFADLEELKTTIGIEAFSALNRQLDLKVQSSYYLISSQGRVNNGIRRIQAIVDKQHDVLLWQKVN